MTFPQPGKGHWHPGKAQSAGENCPVCATAWGCATPVSSQHVWGWSSPGVTHPEKSTFERMTPGHTELFLPSLDVSFFWLCSTGGNKQGLALTRWWMAPGRGMSDTLSGHRDHGKQPRLPSSTAKELPCTMGTTHRQFHFSSVQKHFLGNARCVESFSCAQSSHQQGQGSTTQHDLVKGGDKQAHITHERWVVAAHNPLW